MRIPTRSAAVSLPPMAQMLRPRNVRPQDEPAQEERGQPDQGMEREPVEAADLARGGEEEHVAESSLIMGCTLLMSLPAR